MNASDIANPAQPVPHRDKLQWRFNEDEVSGAPGADGVPPAAGSRLIECINTQINDERFIRDLERLKDLRSFLIQETIKVDPSDSSALEFGQLNLLKYSPNKRNGSRDPTEEEWRQVERHTRILFNLLTPTLRKRFVFGEVPKFFAWLPVCFTLAAIISLILAAMAYKFDLFHSMSVGLNILPFYLGWLMSLGAIGAIAFIGMNALSVQEDITFDLTNRRLIILRIALGALFGLVLSLAFGFEEFIHFCQSINNFSEPGSEAAKANPVTSDQTTITIQAMLLILPFIFGFSTSLVILILNRLVDAVQGFFGRRDQSSSTVLDERALRSTRSGSDAAA